jgi:hypothetical protein
VAIVAAAAALSLMQAARAGPPPVVPGAIEVPAGNKVFLVGHGVGVQIYSSNGTVWSFVRARGGAYHAYCVYQFNPQLGTLFDQLWVR